MFYNFLLFFVYVFSFIYSLFNKKARDFIKKRLFQNFSDLKGNYIWFHMSSVGEVNLSEPIVNKFLSENKHKILITVMTDTGYKLAKEKYKDKLDIYYFPLDNIFVIKKILKKINLKKLILVETEIWPNLISETYKHSSISIINGRISDKSFNSYKKISWFLKELLNKITYFIMQTEIDSKRIIELGAVKERVFNFGNLKFNIQLQNYSAEELNELKEKFDIGDKKVFVAGSTRDGEEELILEVFSKLENYKLFIAPRHLERVSKIKSLINSDEYSLWSDYSKDKNIIIVDKMGILRKLYALSDIAFVGGTLVDVGGHSLLEPLFYMKFPIFGKFTQNVREISKEIIKREIGYKVNNIDEFVEAIKKIENRVDNNKEIANFFEENNKVCDKTFEIIIDII